MSQSAPTQPRKRSNKSRQTATRVLPDVPAPDAFDAFMVEWGKLRNHVLGLRDQLVKMGPGKYAYGTVYKVKEHTVREHKRRAFTAVRLSRPK